ncbi:MAG TPA: toll/interleukin-1 receptor domain-containing protein [Thermoanaerobaculia bacterium]|nr:toll/interleukin-1 receptor domain-containing protein [Thermoanaerobaculia bacterium]
MIHYLVPVDFANLMDSIGIANDRGDRIRLTDRRAVESFMASNGLEPSCFASLLEACPLPQSAIIDRGLMKGLYAYSGESQEAFVYIATEAKPTPLREYSGEICFDLALSYAREELELVRSFGAELEALGVTVFFVDVDADPADPLWGIRFREGLFHSRYFVPFLTEHFLARGGTAVELFDIARATVEHRAEQFFYPLIALVRDRGEIPRLVFSRRGPEAHEFDAKAFEWVRTHVFAVELSQGTPWLVRFFASLAKNARGSRDSVFLDCLAPYVEWVEFRGATGQRYVKLLIRSPALTYHHFVMYSNGAVKYGGVGEPTFEAQSAGDFPDLQQAVLDWLAVESTPREDDGFGVALRPTPAAGTRWFCPNCHHEGPPRWSRPGEADADRWRDLGIRLPYPEGLPMCGRCGRTTMIPRE